MYYKLYFYFVKDSEIDANQAFDKNVDNFLFSLYFDYIKREYGKNEEERDKILIDLFIEIKESLMFIDFIKYNDEDENIYNYENQNDDEDINNYNSNRLIKFLQKNMNEINMEICLNLYGIFVNSLRKTTKIRFGSTKQRNMKLIKFLKDMFFEFDKNDIHKDHTFVFTLKAQKYGDWDDYCYFMNGKEYVKSKDENENDYDGSLRSIMIINKDSSIQDDKSNKYEIVSKKFYLKILI